MWPHYFIVSIDQRTNQTICPQDLTLRANHSEAFLVIEIFPR